MWLIVNFLFPDIIFYSYVQKTQKLCEKSSKNDQMTKKCKFYEKNVWFNKVYKTSIIVISKDENTACLVK